MKWEDVQIGESGIKCLEFPLSDEPRFGVWNIFVTEKVTTISYSWHRTCCCANRSTGVVVDIFQALELNHAALKLKSLVRLNIALIAVTYFNAIMQCCQGSLWSLVVQIELKEMIQKSKEWFLLSKLVPKSMTFTTWLQAYEWLHYTHHYIIITSLHVCMKLCHYILWVYRSYKLACMLSTETTIRS